jgi:hypothetical protein
MSLFEFKTISKDGFNLGWQKCIICLFNNNNNNKRTFLIISFILIPGRKREINGVQNTNYYN